MLRDDAGTVSFEVVPCADVKKRQQALIDDYKAALKDYTGAKDAEGAPVRPAFRVVETGIRGTNAKEKAEEVAVRCEKKYREQQAAKKAKEKGDAAATAE